MIRTIPRLTDIAAAVNAGPLTSDLAARWGLRHPPPRDWVTTLSAQSRRAYPKQPHPVRDFQQCDAHCHATAFPDLPSLAVLRAMPAVTEADCKRWGFNGTREKRHSWRHVAEAMSRARFGTWAMQHGRLADIS